ncbi:MAG: hypothetical protein IMZ55_07430, partial [Acidobacteria bacterium]|nr:hypothetical protein [Acidobacteriota bacterium]
MTTSRRVMPGDKLAIPAEVWNALLDLLNNPPRQRRGLGGSVPRSAWGTTILARNESAAAVAAGQGVYVGTVVVPDPDDALEVFKAGPTITLAAAGTRGGHFAVAAEPMVTNGVGRVWVAGLAVAQV